jgi:hypothetical protein
VDKLDRITTAATQQLGPEFAVNHLNIDINITYTCDMACSHCNRFLDVSPSDMGMTLEQIDTFVSESVAAGRRWNRICITGGEPILHPQALEIAEKIAAYKREFSPDTLILFMTNDVDPTDEKKRLLALLPPEIVVHGSKKDTVRYDHKPMTVAPGDVLADADVDFSNACYLTEKCGVGLDAKGNYHCAVAAAIDRLHGLNLRRDALPPTTDAMVDLMNEYCKRCGMFLWSRGLSVTDGPVAHTRRGPVSEAWSELLSLSVEKLRPSAAVKRV